ncbi:AAA family ATPase [Terrisporobacter petrolearius]|uniref:AAA family ATPase n=1 Tax=Terrisporobacter petrolearius TaxID=1460447 RepID=UPI001D162AE9|nr:MoxR family ATPase [Terrisporobacter petrolearius]
MRKISSISSLWGREYGLEEKPFDVLKSKNVNTSSKYSPDGGFGKGQSILIDPIIEATHKYMDLLDNRRDKGAIGVIEDNICVELEGKSEDIKQILFYNKANGKSLACNYDIKNNICNEYKLRGARKPNGEKGSILFLAMMPEILKDNEALSIFNEYKLHREEIKNLDEVSIKLMATLCDNVYRRILKEDLKLLVPEGVPLEKINIEDMENKKIAYTKLLAGEFKIVKQIKAKKKEIESLTIESEEFTLNLSRKLTEYEKSQIAKLPNSHRVSKTERRICKEIKRNWNNGEMKIANILLEGDAGSGKTQMAKALSHNLGLPYTKITCFSDMDKSDVLGSILPVANSENNNSNKEIEYKYFPSEIVRAFTEGYLLEIQEPTVIRDAAVLMILNSALEADGTINLPTGVVHRHPDFVAVITTNRNYIGCRPLNEALRDRIQHSEKMDLPEREVMIERAIAKTGFDNVELVSKLVDAIIVLDECATANAIHGVAGMRSLFFWLDAIKNGADIRESMYYKVLYKITTNPDEIRILEEAVENNTSLFIETQRRR